ncbi:hypothetical protein SAMN04489835_2172 [Mycolicibacterium rutilum]|uniref:Uncharacterized protein n=1 Tax=Mycolicibacterium rutilum TaxID=370526 RepID=A0A1H6JKK0_MYCRU|nr:hypothetical protein SAMN04489835_2172 [Mycolicibacterium rutilum]
MRGGLVGVSSAAVSAVAHIAAGGEMPGGTSLAVAILVCGTVGAVLARITLDDRRARITAVVAALGLAQALGHVVFLLAGGHHHAAFGLTPVMVAAHVGAAVVLGAGIVAVEHLYVVCASVLRWLRVYATLGVRPRARTSRRFTKVLVARPVLISSGLGMRAPPVRFATA